MNDYQRLEEEFAILLDLVANSFDATEKAEVSEFLDVGEYALALETLCGIMTEEKKTSAKQVVEKVSELCDLMKLDSNMVEAFLDQAGRESRQEQ